MGLRKTSNKAQSGMSVTTNIPALRLSANIASGQHGQPNKTLSQNKQTSKETLLKVLGCWGTKTQSNSSQTLAMVSFHILLLTFQDDSPSLCGKGRSPCSVPPCRHPSKLVVFLILRPHIWMVSEMRWKTEWTGSSLQQEKRVRSQEKFHDRLPLEQAEVT